MKRRKMTKYDRDSVIQIWERSVRFTHYFLKEEDIEIFKRSLKSYLEFADVDIWYKDKLIGFSYLEDDHLNMLFIEPELMGRGYGGHIIEKLKEEGLKSLDVNEDNKRALYFYKKHGFEPIKRNELDGMGKAYPTLFMTLKEA